LSSIGGLSKRISVSIPAVHAIAGVSTHRSAATTLHAKKRTAPTFRQLVIAQCLVTSSSLLCQAGYCLKTTGGPLTRFALSATVTSTRLAILMKGMPLFIP
jgi:hypothetical protein